MSLCSREQHWQIELEGLAEVRVPPTLTGILQARLDSLPREEKTVLQRASVVGRLFWAAVVAELASDKVEAAQVEPVAGRCSEPRVDLSAGVFSL